MYKYNISVFYDFYERRDGIDLGTSKADLKLTRRQGWPVIHKDCYTLGTFEEDKHTIIVYEFYETSGCVSNSTTLQPRFSSEAQQPRCKTAELTIIAGS